MSCDMIWKDKIHGRVMEGTRGSTKNTSLGPLLIMHWHQKIVAGGGGTKIHIFQLTMLMTSLTLYLYGLTTNLERFITIETYYYEIVQIKMSNSKKINLMCSCTVLLWLKNTVTFLVLRTIFNGQAIYSPFIHHSYMSDIFTYVHLYTL